MNYIILKKQDLEAAMARAAKSYTLAGPVPDKSGNRQGHTFCCLAKDQCPDLEYTRTRLSPKALLFPQAEPMFHFKVPKKRDDGSVDAPFMEAGSFKESPIAVVGIRPYDAKAFDLLKLNFDSKDYKDPFFLRRYEQMVRIGLADTRPADTNFSTACGTGPFDETGLDILLADAGDAFIGKVITKKGKEFASAACFKPGGPEIKKQLTAMKKEAESLVDAAPSFGRILGADTLDLYEADHWEALSFSCINCGACTYACPTCWCFDIQDEVQGDEGVRLRLWDSCMTDLYSVHASGHNPRQEGYKRFRNRFMHKLKYFADKYDAGIMCVGCGRCIEGCPSGIDIRKVMAVMNETCGAKEVAS
ncbi:MAG: 4Fe-4S dicluster domain-containing protein [Desulfobacter sp.]|nr:MAG: 4Fe-4S dicluster domain-containing protein [Desulfobacter sp.]